MTAEWVTAVGTVGTFVVIAASAIAALLQIRHMRSGNAIALLTAYNNEFDTNEFQLAFAPYFTNLCKCRRSSESTPRSGR